MKISKKFATLIVAVSAAAGFAGHSAIEPKDTAPLGITAPEAVGMKTTDPEYIRLKKSISKKFESGGEMTQQEVHLLVLFLNQEIRERGGSVTIKNYKGEKTDLANLLKD